MRKAGKKPTHRAAPNADPDAPTAGLPTREAIRQFCDAVTTGTFPNDAESYHLSRDVRDALNIAATEISGVTR